MPSRGHYQITGIFPNYMANAILEMLRIYLLYALRLLAMAITMTGADLSSAAKPWSIQEKSAAVIYQEFHEQVTQNCFSD